MGNPYLKGKFTGLFKQKNKKPTGNLIFSDLQWTYLKIDDCENIKDFNAESQKTGDYWFTKILKSKEGFNPFGKKADILIPKGPNEFYSGDLHNVLIKNLKINHDKSYFLSKDWQEASGDIYFQLSLPPKEKKVAEKITDNNVSGINIINNPIIRSNTKKEYTPITRVERGPIVTGQTNLPNEQNDQVFIPSPTPTSSSSNWPKWLGMIFSYLLYALIAYFLWTHFRTLSYIFLIVLILNIIGQVFSKFGFLRVLGTLAVLGFIAYYLYANYRGIVPDDLNPVKTRDGGVKVSPPKRTKDGQDGNPDYATEKEVQWYDFANKDYLARYQTSQSSFENSVENQGQLKNSITEYNSSIEFYTRFYNELFKMDQEKINQIAKIFSDSASKNSMDQLQTAEMVTTFIQEIPYYLVHDESCENAVLNGNDFLIQYHQDQKPCLPNVAAGVQSPYEFLHNLKGDCDTRSLLGYAILSKLNIASSVWVSETYGHSILGVAVPVGHGIYKEIRGIKHYGVELTAKGFRIGMVAPEQARPNNWDITLYN